MISLALVPLLVASALAGDIVAHSYEPLPQYSQESNSATGEYGYSYSGGPSSKTEFRALDGTTTGAYSYVDAHGILQTVNYIADEFGFRAAGTNIPVDGAVPLDAPDVAAVKAAHLAEHSRATLAALSHQRKKRGIAYAAPAILPVAHAALPIATSSQSRFQVHSGAKIISQQLLAAPAGLLYRKKRGIAAYAAPLPASSAKIYEEFASRPSFFAYAAAPAPIVKTVTQHLPLATSSQSRFQVHNGAKIIEEISTPIAAPVFESLPLATSNQARFQIHNGAKIIQEFHQPLYAAAAAPAAIHTEAILPSEFAPAGPAPAPIAPANENDAISVESA
ncbi:uncharacterized protein LOC103316959 [Nasonia vitripennis]|uniref:Cuticle protein 6 n=1 Tax=Nasonia vitripennis TaxID=7425 RepID=A0A7M7HD28_NASVI|nr:uncharacterized protein LOC103316959 [Nasonia vitripennis]